ncbi:MAG: YceI family protein [Bacteroidales bacterium]|nr:YceI family protein [Bacteroidales bacterium]
MKTINYALTLMILLQGPLLFAQKVEFNPNVSSIEWLGKKIGSQHTGNIQFKSGYLELQDDMIVAGNFVVDMTSITNSDIDNQERNQRLVGHLKSDDFFGVEQYPTASFVVSKSTKFKDGKSTLTGDITIKGKTESITFEVLRTGKEYTASLGIDRSRFDVRFGSGSFFDNLGDNAINDIVKLDIKLVSM